jgi:hypothetical protein
MLYPLHRFPHQVLGRLAQHILRHVAAVDQLLPDLQ